MTAPNTTAPDRTAQVVVVGAGPVGLLLACELARAGVAVIIVERLASPMTESRASQLNTRTAEILHERGLDSLLDETAREARSHFGGLPFDLSSLDSPYAGNWKVPQYRTEAALGRQAERLGAVLLRAHELTDVEQFIDHVLCRIDGPAGRDCISAQYVVGCDGATSTVRRSCGFAASLTGATKELYRADVTGIDIPDRRFERRARGFAVAATRDGVTRVMVHQFGRGVANREKPPEFPEVARLWAEVTGDDISSCNAIWVDSFDNSSGHAARYKRGRVLLAGDAAHWHMPIGGQALNVGLQDAVNLGWKLAGAVHGWAPPTLLDSYHEERHPVAARILDTVTAQEILLLGGPEVEPLRAVLSEVLSLEPARDYLAHVASGLDIQYGGTDHSLAGRRMPHVKLRNGFGSITAAELLAGAEGVILRMANRAEARRGSVAERVTLTSGCPMRVVHAVPSGTDAFDGIATILLRPDGYIAWAGDDEAELNSALERWFGAPLNAQP